MASVGREDVAVCSLNLPGTGYTREEQATLLKEQSEKWPIPLGNLYILVKGSIMLIDIDHNHFVSSSCEVSEDV